MKNNKHFLSVIIPVFCKEKSIKLDLIKINQTLQKIRYDYEIIVVVDGKNSEDRKSVV